MTSLGGASLTCHKISNQPLHVVIPDPVKKKEEAPDVATNLRGGGVMFVLAIFSGLISHNRESGAKSIRKSFAKAWPTGVEIVSAVVFASGFLRLFVVWRVTRGSPDCQREEELKNEEEKGYDQ